MLGAALVSQPIFKLMLEDASDVNDCVMTAFREMYRAERFVHSYRMHRLGPGFVQY